MENSFRHVNSLNRVVIITTFSMLFAFSLSVLSFMLMPSILINNRSITQLPFLLQAVDIKMTWQNPHVLWHTRSPLSHVLDFSTEQICIEMQRFDYCSDLTRLSFEIDFLAIHKVFYSIKTIDIAALKLNIKGKSQPSDTGISLGDVQAYAEYLSYLEKLDLISVDIRIAEILSNFRNGTQGNFYGYIHILKLPMASAYQIKTRLHDKLKKDYLHFDLNTKEKLSGDDFVSSLELVKESIKVNIAFNGLISQKSLGDTKKFDVHYKSSGLSINAAGTIRRVLGRVSVVYALKAKHLNAAPMELNLEKCINDTVIKDIYDIKGKLSCQVIGEIYRKENPQSVRPIFDFQVKVQYALRKDQYQLSLSQTFSPKSLQTNLLTLAGGASAEIQGSFLTRLPRIVANVSLKMEVPKYALLVSRLATSRYAIPSPFNEPDGYLSCQLSGIYDSASSFDSLPIHCSIDLSSKLQRLKAEADFKINMSMVKNDLHKVKVLGDVNISDAAIYLPGFSIGSPIPQFFSDDRIVLNDADSRDFSVRKFRFESSSQVFAQEIGFNITVRTLPMSYIYVHHKTLSKPIPLQLDLHISSESKMSGKVSVSKHSLTLFRRKAYIDHLDVTFIPTTDDRLVSGAIEFDYIDSSIRMLISGTLEKPSISFESEPPVPIADVYSGLLFGGYSESISTNNLRSIEDAKAAFTDGAINLLSMYYLASTPIESIGYNPASKQFVARVRMPNGVLLSLGKTEGSEPELIIRKRIGQNWTIETKAAKDEATGQNRGVAVLRWARRY